MKEHASTAAAGIAVDGLVVETIKVILVGFDDRVSNSQSQSEAGRYLGKKFHVFSQAVPVTPKRTLNSTIIEVRKVVHQRLARFASLPIEGCTESYLFDKDHFCGIRFALGFFRAEWRLNQTQIQFTRNGNNIGQVDLNPGEQRRAA